MLALFPLVRQRRKADANGANQSSVKTKVNSFLLFKEPDVIFILVANGLVYGLTVGIQASSSLLFQTAYPSLSLSEIGLCFLPLGVGCLISTLVTGKFLDRRYKKDRRAWEIRKKREREEAGEKVDAPWSEDDELTFPIERARLKLGAFYTFCVCAVSIGYGWVLDRQGPLAVALVLQFIGMWHVVSLTHLSLTWIAAGYVIIGQMNAFQTLLIDLFPKAGSSATAIVSLQSGCLADSADPSGLTEQLRSLSHRRRGRIRHRPHLESAGDRVDIRPAQWHLPAYYPRVHDYRDSIWAEMEGTSLEANKINDIKPSLAISPLYIYRMLAASRWARYVIPRRTIHTNWPPRIWLSIENANSDLIIVNS